MSGIEYFMPSVVLVIMVCLSGLGVHSILKPSEIAISEDVCLDAGLVVYNNNKCTTKEWVDGQVAKMIKQK